MKIPFYLDSEGREGVGLCDTISRGLRIYWTLSKSNCVE